MSVQGCFTDFHIDFGGTSVWYHVLRGGKVSRGLKPLSDVEAALNLSVSCKSCSVMLTNFSAFCTCIFIDMDIALFLLTLYCIRDLFTPAGVLVDSTLASEPGDV